jgi:hypothetical protein
MGKTIRHGDDGKRNPIAVAMKKRYGNTTSVMKDRREPRGGTRNETRDLLSSLEESNELELPIE